MNCGITGGIDATCLDIRRVGGVDKNAYLANLSDIVSYTVDSDGYVTAINFNAYTGLHKFESRKQAHSGGYTEVANEPGGNKFFQHDVLLKMFANTPADDQVLEELLVANVIVVLETNNRQFKLYGADNGLEQTAGLQNSGQAFASDVADNITLTGAEPDMPKRILDGNYTMTKALLESYVV